MRSDHESQSAPRLIPHLIGAAAVLILAIWMSSGTMAPYAATADYPVVLEPCHYLVNVDHNQFQATYWLLAGEPPNSWAGSVVLRRILFPVIAHPFMLVFGFLAGGLIASMTINAIALVAFGKFVDRIVGRRGAIATAWLLATYPGITYWAGLPYSYAAIVPASLASLILLYALNEATSASEVFRRALFLGIVFLAYDLLPFFGGAALLLLLTRKRWKFAIVAGTAMVLPTIAVLLTLDSMGVTALNSNTVSYLTVLFSYLHARPGWGAYLLDLPKVFASNFLFSNFVFIPVLLVAAVILARRRGIRAFAAPDLAVIAAVGLIFLFNNAAPPYFGWQMRGEWIARLYQPVVAAFLPAIARLTEDWRSRQWVTAVGLTVFLNALIAFGPVMASPLASRMYYRFYIHSDPDALVRNMERYGRRPLGFCRSTHEFDKLANPATPWNRPAYMYRYPPRH